MIHGDDVLEILAEIYERRPVLVFADFSNTVEGDILFQTGGISAQAGILRVLSIEENYFRVATIAPHPNWCSSCTPNECRHAVVLREGRALLTGK